ncbi:MAG: hypothetical protein ACRD2W_20820 [Acidimicrobiales bacterium]
MPLWAQVVVGIAAVGTALGWVFTRAILPGARLITLIDELLPLLPQVRELAMQWPEVKARIERIEEGVATLRSERQP